jgi:hypothetical protein
LNRTSYSATQTFAGRKTGFYFGQPNGPFFSSRFNDQAFLQVFPELPMFFQIDLNGNAAALVVRYVVNADMIESSMR